MRMIAGPRRRCVTVIAIVLFDVLVSPGWLYTIVVGAALAFAVNQIKIDWSALW